MQHNICSRKYELHGDVIVRYNLQNEPSPEAPRATNDKANEDQPARLLQQQFALGGGKSAVDEKRCLVEDHRNACSM